MIFAIIPTSCETAVCSEEAACNFASNLDEVMGSLNQSIVVEDAGMRNGVRWIRYAQSAEKSLRLPTSDKNIARIYVGEKGFMPNASGK